MNCFNRTTGFLFIVIFIVNVSIVLIDAHKVYINGNLVYDSNANINITLDPNSTFVIDNTTNQTDVGPNGDGSLVRFIFNVKMFANTESVEIKNINKNINSKNIDNNNFNKIVFSSGKSLNGTKIVNNNNNNDDEDFDRFDDDSNDINNDNNNFIFNGANGTNGTNSTNRNIVIVNNNNNDLDYDDYYDDSYYDFPDYYDYYDSYGYPYDAYGYGYGYGYGYPYVDLYGKYPSSKHVSRYKTPFNYGPGGTMGGFRGNPFGKLINRDFKNRRNNTRTTTTKTNTLKDLLNKKSRTHFIRKPGETIQKSAFKNLVFKGIGKK